MSDGKKEDEVWDGKKENEAWTRIHETEWMPEEPRGWIQWKGTNACIDLRCVCGAFGHLDGDFLYFVKCNACGRAYAVNPNVQLVELDETERAHFAGRLRDFDDERDEEEKAEDAREASKDNADAGDSR